MDINLFIYVPLFSFWTNICLNTNQSNQSNESSATGTKHVESMQAKLDNYRRHPFVTVIGVMSTAFILTSFCFLHYNCLSDDVPNAEKVKKHVAAKSSRSSKISFSKYKTANLCIPEKQPMLSSIDELSESSSLERSYISFSSENVIRFSNLEKSTIPSSTERFKPSSREKSSKSSSPKKVSRSSHLGKSYRKQSLDKPHKQAYAHKLGSQVHSTHLNRAVMPPSPATLQYPFWPTEQPYPNSPQNKILLLKSSSLQKFTKPPKHTNPKSSVSTGMANRLPRSKLVNSCSYYKEKCPDCISTSKPLVNDISEAKKTNVQNSSFPCEVKPLFKYLHKVDSRHNALNDNVNDSDMMTYVSDNDLEREITIICNINLGEVIHNGTPRNEEFNKNKNYL